MKEDAGQTLARQWEMLRAVPRAPRKITTAELEVHLKDRGYGISRRSIERDLQKLSARFPLTLDDRSRPFGWSWAKNAHFDLLPGLTTSQAVALLLAKSHLSELLPHNLHDDLSGLFAAAEKSLSASGWKDWHKRTAIIGGGLSLMQPKIGTKVLACIQSAMAGHRQLRVRYRTKGSREFRDYVMHPLGLIARGPVLYLAATLFDYDDVRQFALHRFGAVKELNKARREPKGFDFASYASGVGASLGARGLVRLLCRFDAAAAEHLRETPLSDDQTWTEIESGDRIEVSATVECDDRLRWWLLGFGAQVEVIAPTELRRDMAHELSQAAERYS